MSDDPAAQVTKAAIAAWLRAQALGSVGPEHGMMLEAAAALDRLAARVAKLEQCVANHNAGAARRGGDRIRLRAARPDWPDEAVAVVIDAEARAEAAEAALAQARAALEPQLNKDARQRLADTIEAEWACGDKRVAEALRLLLEQRDKVLAALARPAPAAEGGDHG